MTKSKSDLKERFKVVHLGAITSKEQDDLETSLNILEKAFCLLVECNPEAAEELLECYEGTLKFYNYLSEEEAEEILEDMINQDGSKGPKWRDCEEFFEDVEEMGGKIESEPHYNKHALHVAMHKFHSDHHSAIAKWVGDDKQKYFEACYDLAVTQLKDRDCLSWIRWYFDLED